MSKYTTRQILDMIEANGGPEGLDLSGKDLRAIDLSHDTIQAELEQVREEHSRAKPVWVSDLTNGINLEEADLFQAKLIGTDLTGAKLAGANLQEADLHKAIVTDEQLAQAESLEGATLPDGREHE